MLLSAWLLSLMGLSTLGEKKGEEKKRGLSDAMWNDTIDWELREKLQLKLDLT